MIKIDPRSFNISDEYAGFIDLDLNQTINLEMKFNVQRALLIDNTDEINFKHLMKYDGFKEYQWFQRKPGQADVEENKDMHKEDFFEKFIVAVTKQLFDDPVADLQLRHGESFIELMLRRIAEKLS